MCAIGSVISDYLDFGLSISYDIHSGLCLVQYCESERDQLLRIELADTKNSSLSVLN